MSKITRAEIFSMTKEQNYMRGYKDGKYDAQELKTGQWLYGTYILEDTGHYYAECSYCHSVRIIGNYCPNCGAKMIELEESEV